MNCSKMLLGMIFLPFCVSTFASMPKKSSALSSLFDAGYTADAINGLRKPKSSTITHITGKNNCYSGSLPGKARIVASLLSGTTPVYNVIVELRIGKREKLVKLPVCQKYAKAYFGYMKACAGQ